MTGKEYLRRVREAEGRLRIMEAEYKQLRADVLSLRAIDYAKDKITSGTSSDLSGLIARLETEQMKLEEAWDELIRERRDAKVKIDRVKDMRYREILTRRYILCENWQSVADSMGYEFSWVIRLHGQALKEFTKANTECK